jgi:hypothetical protein
MTHRQLEEKATQSKRRGIKADILNMLGVTKHRGGIHSEEMIEMKDRDQVIQDFLLEICGIHKQFSAMKKV